VKILIIQGGIDSGLVTGEQVVINNDILYLRIENQVHYESLLIPSGGIKSTFLRIGALFWSFTSYKKITNLIEVHKPDIIHFHSTIPYLSFSAIYAAFISKVPVVQTIHNGRWLCLEGGYFRNNTFCNDCVGSYGWLGVKRGCGHGRFISIVLFMNNIILRKFGFLFNCVSRFIAVSEFVKEQHVSSGFPSQKVIVRNNGFDFSFKDNHVSKNISCDEEGIVFAGRISVAKGSLVIKYLIPRLNCPIKIIGNGPDLEMLKKYCNKNNYNHVVFYGKIQNNKTIDLIKHSTLTIVPSQCGDSFPTVALESISVSTPVIASNLGGLTDLINSSGGGYVVQHDDNNEFLKVIKYLLDNKGYAKSLGNAGRKYMKENVSIKKQGIELTQIYEQVVFEHQMKF